MRNCATSLRCLGAHLAPAISVAAFVLASATDVALAQIVDNCENIAGNKIIVGEARYLTRDGTDQK